jgi:integrase
MGAAEVTAFLSSLAERAASRSTQNQALSAVLFLHEMVLGQRLPWMAGIVRAGPVKLPLVLSRDEVAALLGRLHGAIWLAASLMYGGGLRLLETLELRVKDLHFDRGEIRLRGGKGGKDRVTMLPGAVRGPLEAHLRDRRALHEPISQRAAAAWRFRGRSR